MKTDINGILGKIRAILADLDHGDYDKVGWDRVNDLADLVTVLDKSMTAGVALPTDWQRARNPVRYIIDGSELRALVVNPIVNRSKHGDGIHSIRFEPRRHGVAVKFNDGQWSAPLGRADQS